MANKQKTRVVLPGGIQGLVHTLQNGTAEPNLNPQVDVTKISEPAEETPAGKDEESAVAAEPQPTAQQPQAGPQAQSATQQSAQPAAASGVGESQAAAPVQEKPAEAPVDTPANTPAADAPASTPERAPRGRRPKENTMKEYTIVKDDSRDSWDLFLDMAKQYKDGGGKLATIYIDESLKNVLDRMKYCGPEKLSTSAILSSIVARFIFDHEDDIKKVMFSGRLI